MTCPPQIGPDLCYVKRPILRGGSYAKETLSSRRHHRQTQRSGHLISQGKSVAETIKHLGVSDVTYYRWRKEYGGMTTTQVKRLKELEKENLRLRRVVSDLTLDKLILQEAAKGNY